MKHCPKCLSRFPDEVPFCVNCGTELIENDPSLEFFDFNKTPREIERIYKRVKVAAGESYDLKTKYFNTIRITLREVIEVDAKEKMGIANNREYRARLYVDMGGALVYGGPGATQSDTNEFVVGAQISPSEEISIYLEEPISIYYFYNDKLDTYFFRVLVERIDHHTKQVELNIVYLRYGEARHQLRPS